MKAPLGKNEIGKLMKTAAQATGLQGNIANHSLIISINLSCLLFLLSSSGVCIQMLALDSGD